MKKVIGILLVLLITGMVFGADSELKLEAEVTSSHGLLLSIQNITSIHDFNHASEGMEILDFESLNIDGANFTESLTKSFYIAFKRNNKTDTSISLSGSPLKSENASDPKIGYSIVTESSSFYTPVEDGTLTVPKEAESDVTVTVGTFAGRNGMKVDSTEAVVTLTKNDVVNAVPDTPYSTIIKVGIVSGS